MKQMLLASLLLIYVSGTVYANPLNEAIKKQCQYLVYRNGEASMIASAYLTGVVDGQAFLVSDDEMTDFAKKADIKQTVQRACKEALNNNRPDKFDAKYSIGVTVTIKKSASYLSTLK